MKKVLKRIVAYIIDIFLVMMLSTFITSNPYINRDYNKYIDELDKYSELSDNYNKSVEELKEKNMNEQEYDEELEKINLEYEKIEENYSYKLIKLSIIPAIIEILCIVLYFVLIQCYFNGQTLGKKLMKLRVESNNGKPLTLLNYFVRSLILNGVLINVLNIVFVIFFSKKNYLVCNQVLYVISEVVELCLLFTIIFDKNNRGIHDYISNTKVVELGLEN